MNKRAFGIGERIDGRYRVLDMRQSGGMGMLYRVADEAQEDAVLALKTVHLTESLAYYEHAARYFRHEFQLLTQLQHPNLVSVHDYGVTKEGLLYFTMEWLSGDDLESLLGLLPFRATVPVIVQICRALAYLHSRDILHGDLKPGNVFLLKTKTRESPQIKLLDFGLARELQKSQTHRQFYTPGYVAPEMENLQATDQRADLYGLGATWYALLLGEPPRFMMGPGRERLLQFYLLETLGDQTLVSQQACELIVRLLAADPADRYESANAVIEAINMVIEQPYSLETPETATSYALRTYFVDRAAEQDQLRACWERAQAQAGQLVLVAGEAGVGKTRLLEELEVQAETSGARVIWGRCAATGGRAYQPWREVLRMLWRYVEDGDVFELPRVQTAQVLVTLLPELAERSYLEDVAPLAELEPEAAQQRLNMTLYQFLEAVATSRPTVLVIEDAHVADQATLDLLSFLQRVGLPADLLIAVLYRSEDLPTEHPLRVLPGQGAAQVTVERLTSEATAALACSMLGLEELPALLAQRVQEATGGNALFVQELLRSMAAEGDVLQRTVTGWRVDADALRRTVLPESVQQVIGRRLEQVPAETRQVLGWAAVMGTDFWEGAVATIGEAALETVQEALQEAWRQDLIAVRSESALTGEPEYRFNHPVVREAAYARLDEGQRATYHRRAAQWLIARDESEVEEHLGLIGQQFERGRQWDEARHYLQRAGGQAAAQYANEAAIAYYERALALPAADDEVGDETRRLHVALGDIYRLIGRYEKAVENYQRALGGDLPPTQSAEIRRKLAKVWELQGHHDKAMALLQETQAAVPEEKEPLLVASLYNDRAWIATKQGNYEQALVLCLKGLDVADRLPDSPRNVRIKANLQHTLASTYFRSGDFPAAIENFEASIEKRDRIGDLQGMSRSHSNLAALYWHQGKYDLVVHHTQQSLEINRRIGHTRGMAVCFNNLGAMYFAMGEYAQAVDYYEQSLQIKEQIGDPTGMAYAYNNLGEVYYHLEAYQKALRYLGKAAKLLQEVNAKAPLCDVYRLLAETRLTQRNLPGALSDAKRYLELSQEIGNREFEGTAYRLLGQIQSALGDGNTAQSRLQQSIEVLSDLDVSVELGRSYYHLGLVRSVQIGRASCRERVCVGV